MGSSAALTVSLLHALLALQGITVEKSGLAKNAITLDQNRENVGSQDQILTCYGGLNQVCFSHKVPFVVTPLNLSPLRANEFKSHLMLFYTGSTRLASVQAEKWIDAVKPKEKLFQELYEIAGQAFDILNSSKSLLPLGELFHQSWLLKREIHKSVSNDTIDLIYERALKAGALGGKLLGAGGGGFFLLFVPPEKQASVSHALSFFKKFEFDWDYTGTTMLARPYTSQISSDRALSLQAPLR
jgi:D-glycero-alpha-D-manno-heptose-7-phosphate kinase